LIAWEWLQRERDIFTTFDVTHYRPKKRPNAVRVLHEKIHEENWVPLFDDRGVPLYPELMAELDALKRGRIGGLMLRRDWGERAPWPTGDNADLTHMSRKVEGSSPRRWIAGRADIYELPTLRLHRRCRRRPVRRRNAGSGAAQERESSSALCQTHHEAGRRGREEAARCKGELK